MRSGSSGRAWARGLYDQQLGDACAPRRDWDDEPYFCWPRRVAAEGRWCEQGCGGLAHYGQDPDLCGDPVLATGFECEIRTGFWAVGGRREVSAPLYERVAYEECD